VTTPSVTALIGLFAGMGGWCFTNFLFRPWKELQELRRKSRFEMLYCSPTAPGTDAFRKLSIEMLALNETSPFLFRQLLRFTSYNLTEAAHGMRGLCWSEGCLSQAIFRHRVEKGLLLRLEFSDEQFEEICKRCKEDLEEDDDGGDFADPVEELFFYHHMDNR
jgi:hypothetical protein